MPDGFEWNVFSAVLPKSSNRSVSISKPNHVDKLFKRQMQVLAEDPRPALTGIPDRATIENPCFSGSRSRAAADSRDSSFNKSYTPLNNGNASKTLRRKLSRLPE